MDNIPITKTLNLTITPPRIGRATFHIEGTAPLMINKFSAKAQEVIKAAQEAGSTAKSKRTRAAKDFNANMLAARHISREGWDGAHAAAFRNGCIDACRIVNFKMTLAKLAVFVIADGYDKESGEPLIRIIGPEPELSTMAVRNSSGVMDLRARPVWHQWAMNVRMQWDRDVFQVADVYNLLSRVGLQVGIGEGRPNGRMGNGMGLGLFRITDVTDVSEDE